MIWKDYSSKQNTHAFLSASRYHWLRYSPDKLETVYKNHLRTKLGTEYHKLAADLIRLAIRLSNSSASFNSFVNDAIGFKMVPEQVLYYSENCYGTADAIGYYNGVLRIHDLKTGLIPGSMDQVLIYAALFCLDYKETPSEIVLRIYQNEEILEYEPTIDDVNDVMERIIVSDKIIEKIKQSGII